MKNILHVILVSIISFSVFAVFSNSFAQNSAQWTVETSIIPDHIDFTDNDKYIVFDNEKGYEVWNNESQSKVLEGKYRNKMGRSFSGVYLTEGSAYLLFEKEEIFLQIDYTLNFTRVDACDLTNGKQIWSIDNLDMEISVVEALYQLLENAQRFVQNEENMANATTSLATGIPVSGDNMVPVSYTGHDKIVNKLISYLPYKSAIAVNGKEALQLLDLKTGNIIWQQPELRGAIGEIFYDSANEILIAVRINKGELQNIASRPEVQALNAENGDLLWNIKYNGDFVPDIAYVVEETLVLPYFGLMLIDIKTGEERDGDVKAAMERQRKIQRNMSVLGSTGLGDNCSYPFLDENGIIHYVVGYAQGEYINPDGNKKAYLQIDIHQDKIVMAKEDIASQGNRVIQEEFTDDLLYLKLTKGLSGSYIVGLDRNTGNIVFETDKVKNRLGTDFDPFLLNDDRIVDISSKGIHIYDARTGVEQKRINHDKIGIGKFRNQVIFDKGLMLFGTKGVAITDNNGNLKASFDDIEKVRDLRISDNIWLLDDKKLLKIAIDPIAVAEEIKLLKDERMFFSPSGAYLAKMNTSNNKISVLKN